MPEGLPVLYAATAIHDGGSIRDLESGALLAEPGTPRVPVNTGHLEEDRARIAYLIRLEGACLAPGAPPPDCRAERPRAEGDGT
jgi:hypothetical protein